MINKKTSYIRKPHYYETDMMGVVHHSNYIRWFEEARVALMEQAGFPYHKMEAKGVLIPIISVECQYRNFVRFGDEVIINVKIDSFSGVKMVMSYEVYLQDDLTLCVTGKTGHCFINPDLKILKLKRDAPQVYDFFNSLVSIG